ncbi:MAG: ABC transporter ATP-binding protein [Candidatus Caenarcaniphilales bacterium]|nr:ABC transporter ATP-binding protein [Candidatus Caenarcaniphilales bacterium]
MTLLKLENIVKTYNGKFALAGVDLEVKPGEIVGLAGESGSGKSTLARIITGAEPPDSGSMQLMSEAVDLNNQREKLHKRKIQMVFQNALGSFNPKFRLRSSIQQPLIEHKISSSAEDLENKILQILESVSLEKELLNRFPHQVSGGQIQRAAIARAIACEPNLLIADEPTSALDVSIRSQILKLFKNLTLQKNISCLVISHDLPSLRFLADRIYVMYKGKIVEAGLTAKVLDDPKESYTKRLIAAIPSLNPDDKTFERFKLAS